MTRLALRRDGDQVRAALAIAFYDRRDSLSPVDSSCATPQWIANDVDEILGTVERLYGDAVPSGGAGIPRPHGVPPKLLESLGQLAPLDTIRAGRATTSRATRAI